MLGENATRVGSSADGKRKDARVDPHQSAALGWRADVSQDNLRRRENECRAGTRDEARSEEKHILGSNRTQHVARDCDDATNCQGSTPSDAVGKPPARYGKQEAGQPIQSDSQSDRRWRDTKAGRIQW